MNDLTKIAMEISGTVLLIAGSLGGIYYGIGKIIQKKEEKIIEKYRGYQK